MTLPDTDGLSYERYPASGSNLLLWVASERGLSDAERTAAQKLAQSGMEVWQLDPGTSYWLPPLPSSMDAVPVQDMHRWIEAALATGKQVRVLAVARAAKPVLRATGTLPDRERAKVCVVLLYPNLYASADPLDAPIYLSMGHQDGLQVLILQPQKSAATPWLPDLIDTLQTAGMRVQSAILEKLREGYWVRDEANAFEIEAGKELDKMLRQYFDTLTCWK
ncbi:MAG: hypothetical protein ABL892_08835 [Thiobacillaceae bacterium]